MTYRNVSTAIWTDDTILGMSPEQKLLFLYLYTSPYTSPCGIFKLHPKTMGFQMGLVHAPFESTLRGFCAAFPDFVAVDWQTMEIALLQYPKQLLISANHRAMAIVEKEILKIESQYLIREMIAKNSASLSKGYLAQLRRLQMQKINTPIANELLHGDLLQLPENQQEVRKREIEIESKDILSISEKIDPVSPTEKEPDFYAEIIEYLNAKTGRKFRPNTPPTKKAISARLSEGYTVENFKAVIDNRCDAWLNDVKMCEYLRPETLFRPAHFESYLNAGINSAKANTDIALRDCELPPDIFEKYGRYIEHAQKTYPALWASSTRIFSHCDYLDYWNNATIQSIPLHLTVNQKRDIMLKVHHELNAAEAARKRYTRTIDAYHAAIRQAMKQQPVKL